jgi:hypothetical protein
MPPKKKDTKGKSGTSAAKKTQKDKIPPAIVITLTLPHAATMERSGTMMITRGSLGTMRQFTYRNPVDLAEVIRAGVLGLNKIEMQPPAKAAMSTPKAEIPAAPAAATAASPVSDTPSPAATAATPPVQPVQAPPLPQLVEPPPVPVEAAPIPPVVQTPPAQPESVPAPPAPVEIAQAPEAPAPTPTTPTPPTLVGQAVSQEAIPAASAALPPVPTVDTPPPAAVIEVPTVPVTPIAAPPPVPVVQAPAAVPQTEPDFKNEDDFAEEDDDEEEAEVSSDIDPIDPFWATAEFYADLAAQREGSVSTQPAQANGAAQPSLF